MPSLGRFEPVERRFERKRLGLLVVRARDAIRDGVACPVFPSSLLSLSHRWSPLPKRLLLIKILFLYEGENGEGGREDIEIGRPRPLGLRISSSSSSSSDESGACTLWRWDEVILSAEGRCFVLPCCTVLLL